VGGRRGSGEKMGRRKRWRRGRGEEKRGEFENWRRRSSLVQWSVRTVKSVRSGSGNGRPVNPVTPGRCLSSVVSVVTT
jgi:hypothetical protein